MSKYDRIIDEKYQVEVHEDNNQGENTGWINVPLRKLITPVNKRNRVDLPLLSVVREKGVIMRNHDKSKFIIVLLGNLC